MIWNPFRRKPDPARDRVDEMANRLASTGQVDRIEDQLEQMRRLDLTVRELGSWHHLYGSMAYQRGDHALAMERFQAGLEACPDSREIRFSLGQEHLHIGQPGVAFELFDECRFPAIPADFVMAISRYAYLFGEYDRGIAAVLDFFPYYYELRILDDNFLFMRGLPFLSDAWGNLATHCVLGGRTEQLTRETEEIQRRCEDFDSAYLDAMLAAVSSDDYSAVVGHEKRFLAESRRYPGPNDMYEVRIAVLEAFAARDYETASRRISAVRLSGEDFPWLPDILTVASAKVADKFDNTSREQVARRIFLEKQPLLFEPEHVVTFNILDYQEKLKPEVELVRLANQQ